MACPKLYLSYSLRMKLFRRGDPVKIDTEPVSVPTPPAKPQPIPLNAEQRAMLEQPVDSRVDRILEEIYADKAAAERAIQSRQIIRFPGGGSSKPRVVQDGQGFWRILPPAPAPEETHVDLLDAL